jgi:myosin heavy subunit
LLAQYIGDVLISVNPYKQVRDFAGVAVCPVVFFQLPIYGQARIAEHSGMQSYQLEPHVYGVAENMYKQV